MNSKTGVLVAGAAGAAAIAATIGLYEDQLEKWATIERTASVMLRHSSNAQHQRENEIFNKPRRKKRRK